MFKKALAMVAGIVAVASAGVFVCALFMPALVAPLAAILGGNNMLILISAAASAIGLYGYAKLGGKISWRKTPVTLNQTVSAYGTVRPAQTLTVDEARASSKITKLADKQEVNKLVDQARVQKTGTALGRFFAGVGIGKKALAAKQSRLNAARA